MKIFYLLALLALCPPLAAQHYTPKTLLIRNALLFDGSGKKPLKGYDILIEKGLIQKTGKNLQAPRNAQIIDATGKTVIPGLIDMHGHLYAYGATQVEAYPALYLAGGVTTIFTPGEFDPELTWTIKDSIAKGLRVGPDILSGGPYFTSRPAITRWMDAVSTADSIDLLFARWKGRLDGIKVYQDISEEHFDRVIKLARQNKLLVTGHLKSISATYAVQHGINGLEHGLLTITDFGGDFSKWQAIICSAGNVDLANPQVHALIKLIIQHKVYMDPTMVTLENMLSDFKPVVPNLEAYLDEMAHYAMIQQQSGKNRWGMDSCVRKALEKQFAFNRLFYEQGGILVAGTDPVSPEILPGFGIKREIMLFQKSGIPLSQCIRIASLNGAIALGIDKKTGSIEPGKRADLSIIDGDITKNIEFLYNTTLVIKHGVIYKSSGLLQSAKSKVHTGRWTKRPGR